MRAFRVLCLSAALALSGAAHAAPAVYTSSAAFFASLPGPASVADFDGLQSGDVIASSTAAYGITFVYDLDGVDLTATDGTAAGGDGPFPTTSPPLFLGTSDLDVLLDGDDLSLGFATANAVGIFVVTAETPGFSLFDGDIRLVAGGAQASLAVADVETTLADGSLVYFLGVIDPAASFTSASVETFGAGGEFAFNVDDLVTAVPEPGFGSALVPALLVLAVFARRRRSVSKERACGA